MDMYALDTRQNVPIYKLVLDNACPIHYRFPRIYSRANLKRIVNKRLIPGKPSSLMNQRTTCTELSNVPPLAFLHLLDKFICH